MERRAGLVSTSRRLVQRDERVSKIGPDKSAYDPPIQHFDVLRATRVNEIDVRMALAPNRNDCARR
jgi:hypothetical protein